MNKLIPHNNSDVSEEDAILLSALLDDELDSRAKAQLLARLEREDVLQQYYVNLQQVQRSVRVHKRHAHTDNRTKRYVPLAAAASFVLALIFTLQWQGNEPVPKPSNSIAAIHAELAQLPLQFAQHQQAQLLPSTGQTGLIQPDLSLSKLYLVSRSDDARGRVLHYRGVNGCKLTLHIDQAEAAPVNTSQWQYRQWQLSGYTYQVIASGMDAGRFESVSDFIEQLSLQAQPLDKFQMAMLSHYRAAQPCG
ncbi:MAG: hypothetical protein ACPG4U_03115 [Pseudomonadales bacterium]